MKPIRILLTIIAFGTAMAATLASGNLIITNTGCTVGGAGPFPTVELNVCDCDLITGIQCTVRVAPNLIKPAYCCATHRPLYRPV